MNHIEGKIEDVLTNEIKKNAIDVVMTGGLSGQFIILKKIVDTIHKENQKIKIIMGGGIISGDSGNAMTALEYVDVGVIGEGEITALELATYFEKGVDNIEYLKAIDGIIFRDPHSKDKYILTSRRAEIDDLDTLPFPDYEGFGLNVFLDYPPMAKANVYENRSFYVIGSRSCPNRCTFCFHPSGSRYRQRSVENILSEIRYLVENYDVRYICMEDELFARDKERIRFFCRALKKMNLNWHGYFRIDDVDEELVGIIKDSTCKAMYFGVESADNNVLKSMRKNITIEQTERALAMVHEANIPFLGNLIFGDVEETFESASKTIDWWENHRAYYLDMYFILIYPGSAIYKYAVENGIIPDAVQFLRNGCPPPNISRLSESEAAYIAKRIMMTLNEKAYKLEDSELLSLDKTGRMTLSGKCPVCKSSMILSNIKVFTTSNVSPCPRCGTKIFGNSKVLEDILVVNIKKLAEKGLSNNKKIGFWGITQHTLPLFEYEDFFRITQAVFIDNASMKQEIKIRNKMVYAPEILGEGAIETVVFFYPEYYQEISMQVSEKYPSVKQFINAIELLFEVQNE